MKVLYVCLQCMKGYDENEYIRLKGICEDCGLPLESAQILGKNLAKVEGHHV